MTEGNAVPETPKEDPRRGRVTVFGKNVFLAPLLDASEANTIVIRRVGGAPMAFFSRLVDDTWVFCNESDKDWADAKARFGVS
jgi:hypothetical protein